MINTSGDYACFYMSKSLVIIFIWCKIIASDNLHLVFMYRKLYESLLEWKQKYAGREAVKWLVEDGRYDYMEIGSLVSIRF